MASGHSRRNKRTSGTVQYSTKSYGFIDLHNKDLPISKVFFDRTSYGGDKSDVSMTFPKGTNVTLTFVPTDREHKVKYKAINLQKQGAERQKSDDKSGQKRNQQTPEKHGRGGDEYLKKYLSDNGAQELSELTEQLSRRADNCPRFLKNADTDELVNFINRNAHLFVIKHGFLCLQEIEDQLIHALSANLLSHPRCHFSNVPQLFPCNNHPGIYLYGNGAWQDGLKDFIARNAEQFIFWDDAVYSKENLFENAPMRNEFLGELKAVKYYSEFVVAKCSLPISSLSGHFNQASAAVKKIVSPKRDEFSEFLEKHSFFFTEIEDDVITCKPHRLAVIDRAWLKKGGRSRQQGKNGPQKRSDVNDNFSRSNSDAFPQCQELSKAFSGFSFQSAQPKMPLPCSDNSDSFVAQFSFQSRTTAQPCLQQYQESGKPHKKQKIYGPPEARAFRDVVGGDLAQAIENELLSVGGQSLNDVVLVRFNVGKKPTVKITKNDSSSNQPLNQAKEVDVEDLQKLVRHKLVAKTGVSSHYGIKGTLHSMRTIEQGGKISGLTLLCQLHKDSDGLGIDILRRKRLTAVLSDPGNRPLKFVYNYLRTKCRELAPNKEVLVLDVDGQLSGCDDQPHSSLGNVDRIACTSSSELPERINAAIQHMHEYVVLVGVDTKEILQMIQKMCGKGIEVIAEIPMDLRSEVENMFS